MSKTKRGFVIAVDGPDGVGKTTQITLLAEILEQRGESVHVTRFSGGTPISKLLREVSLSDTPRSAETDLYISLAMGVDLGEELQQRKAKGQICLVDRSPITPIAYNVYGSQLQDKSMGNAVIDRLTQSWQLDVLIYMDAPQIVLDERRRHRTDKPLDYFEKKDADFHERVRQGYEAGLKHVEENLNIVEVVYIDASKTIDEIKTEISEKLSMVL